MMKISKVAFSFIVRDGANKYLGQKMKNLAI